MTLLLQILPYLLFAVTAAVAGGTYVVGQSNARLARRRTVASALAHSPPTSAAFARETPARTVPAGTAQILRLHQLGIAVPNIAAALAIPLQEAELVVRLEQARRARGAPAEIPRPAVVE